MVLVKESLKVTPQFYIRGNKHRFKCHFGGFGQAIAARLTLAKYDLDLAKHSLQFFELSEGCVDFIRFGGC